MTIRQSGLKALLFLGLGCVCLGSASMGLAVPGDSGTNAIPVKYSSRPTTLTLVEEAGATGEPGGACYFKITLSQKSDYTLWSQTSGAKVSADLTNPDMFHEESYFQEGLNFRFILEKDSWDDGGWDYGGFDDDFGDDFGDDDFGGGGFDEGWGDEGGWAEPEPEPDPEYIFRVAGQIGTTVDIYVKKGVHALEGSERNPIPLKMSSDVKEEEGASDPLFIEEDPGCYFETDVNAGVKYRFGVTGGTEKQPLLLEIFMASNNVLYPVATEAERGWQTDYNEALTLVPQKKGKCWIKVSLMDPEGPDRIQFSLRYQRLDPRPLTDHPVTPLNEENKWTATFTPGRMNAWDSGFYDEIIDERLFSVSVEKGKRYGAETAGAMTNLLMIVYNSKGEKVASNRNMGNGTFDVRACFVPDSKGIYYIGVCQDLQSDQLDDLSKDQGEMAIRFIDVSEIECEDDPLDPMDDTVDGATPLAPVAVVGAGDPREVDTDGNGPHTLSLKDWQDYYSLAVRKGITYQLKISWDGEGTPLHFNAKVFEMQGSKEGEIKTTGSISPDGQDVLAFTAENNGVYYLRLTPAEGLGLDIPAYRVHASAFMENETLGTLTVNLKGPASSEVYWQLESDGRSAPQYRSGQTLLLPSGYMDTIRVSPAKGFSNPTEDPRFQISSESPANKVFKYNDTFDTKDDTVGGATSLSFSNKPNELSRSLWNTDLWDCFKIKTKAGTYYNFSFTKKEGDPAFFLVDEKGGPVGDVIAKDEACSVLANDSETWYLKVGHKSAEGVEDSIYTLAYSSINVGSVSFAKDSVKVKEDKGYVELSVKRSSKEGAVRVKYTTAADTAKPGKDYYPDKGELSWADGDSKAQTIRIRLIPNGIYEGGDKTFTVKLETTEREGEEIIPAIEKGGIAEVVITEADKAAPGELVAFAYGEAKTPFDNQKKPAMTVAAGDPVKIWFKRADGADGTVGINVSTAKGKAIPGTQYEETEEDIIWEGKDSAPRSITIQTFDKGYLPSAAFTVKVKALSGKEYARAKVATSSITVNIVDKEEKETMYDYAKDLPRDGGIAIKEGQKGTWYMTTDGALRSVPMEGRISKAELTFNLTGPGVFSFNPKFSDEVEMTAQSGREKAETLKSGELQKVYVQPGKQTLKVSAERKSGTAPVVELSALEDGLPYQWRSLADIRPLAPTVDKAVLLPGANSLEWTHPEDDDIAYEVYLTTAKEKKNLISEENRVDDPSSVELAADTDYVWKVVVIVGGDKLRFDASKNPWTFSTTTETAPETTVSGNDAYGSEVEGGAQVIKLIQGVKADMALGSCVGGSCGGGETFSYKVINGKLPSGIKLEKDGTLSGIPAKEGSYSVVCQVTDDAAKTQGGTIVLNMDVAPLKSAVGTFNGLFTWVEVNDGAEDLWRPAVAISEFGSITFTVSSQGKLSAKVSVAGKSYSFKDTGFATAEEAPDGTMRLQANMESIQKIGKDTYTNRLAVWIPYTDLDDYSGLKEIADVELTMAIPALNKGEDPEIVKYEGALYRDNTKVPELVDQLAPYVGYYTVAFPSDSDPSDGEPKGCGYLTLTVDAKGKVKFSGALADGNKVSGSALAYPSEEDGLQSSLMIPIYSAKKLWAFGGWIQLKEESSFAAEDGAGSVVITTDGEFLPIYWSSDDVNATESGDHGFSKELIPVGGFYDKLVNLQAHYLNYDLSVAVEQDLPRELLPEGFEFVPSTFLTGFPIELAGDSFAVPKRVLEKELDENGRKTSLNDWETSINPANLTISFKRATGLFSGGFSIWAEGESGGKPQQKEIAKVKHQGVLLLTADWAASGDEPFWAALGFFNVPVKIQDGKKSRTWNASYPFEIEAVEAERDWSEGWID